MELKWLEDFVCLAETLSFSRAAEMRHVSQPAFSRRIRQLEQWLGVTLINRAMVPADLTPEGRKFLPVAIDNIRLMQETRRALRPDSKEVARTVVFSSLHTLTLTFMPDWLQKLATIKGGLRSRIAPDRGGIEDNINTLVEKEADFFLTYSHPLVPILLDETRFPRRLIGKERLLPVCPASAGKMLDKALKTNTPLDYLSYGDYSFFGMALGRLFALLPTFERAVSHENTMSVSLKAMTLAGWGTVWLPESLVSDELETGTLVTASDDPAWILDLDICIYRLGGPSRPIVEAVWNTLS